MTSPQQYDNLIGSTAVDSDGSKVGKIGQVYLNDDTGQPEWVTVSTGLFGTRESAAPLYGAQTGSGDVRLAVTKQMIKDAPNIDADRHLDGAEVDALYQYYAGYLGSTSAQAGTGESTYGTDSGPIGDGYAGTGTAGTAADGTVGYDTSGPTTDGAMTRSEERLHVGTESV